LKDLEASRLQSWYARCCAAVLPTPAKCFLPDFLKNSAAGEKIRPHTLFPIEAGLIDDNKDSEGMVFVEIYNPTILF
jgi:hypothetical protein